MKYVFWSPVHGQAAVTADTLAVSMITGMHFRKKAVLTQTQFNYNNLEAPIVGNNAYDSDTKEYFREVGLDPLIRCFKASKLDRSTLENCCIALENTNLLLLPGTSKTIRESFEYEMEMVVGNLFKAIEDLYGIIFVDINSGDNPLSQKLIREADLVVVNLNQNIGITDLYFRKFAKNMPRNVFYLFGKYDNNSKYNINNIRRKYHRHINVNNSGVVPYNIGFMDAQADGKAVEFIRCNLDCTQRDENYYFIEKVKSATTKILKLTGVNIERI